MYMCDLRKRKGIEYFLTADFFHEDFSSFIIISRALDINISIYLDAKPSSGGVVCSKSHSSKVVVLTFNVKFTIQFQLH